MYARARVAVVAECGPRTDRTAHRLIYGDIYGDNNRNKRQKIVLDAVA